MIDRYTFPIQEMEIRRKDELKLKDGKKLGDVVDVDRMAIDHRRAKGAEASGQSPHGGLCPLARPTNVLEDAIFQIGERAGAGGGDPLR